MGGIGGEAIKKQLGRPNLNRLTVFVREAAQNSWDAAASPDTPVSFSVALCDLPDDVAAVWRRVLAAGAPDADQLPLRATLDRSALSVLFVADRGTTGLGGPTRANEADPDEPHDYVSFFLKVGDARDTEYGGGTYGYGKAVFFRASAASTIVVHTRCENEHGDIESRLIGGALGPTFRADGVAHTGRHWLGLPMASDALDPIRGDEADRLAAELGFPSFDEAEQGTTIAIVAPDFDAHSDEAAMRLIADSILWHLWPKMVARDDHGPAMAFSVTHNGQPVSIADPAEHPALRQFVRALATVDRGGTAITYGASATPIGRLSLHTTFDPPPQIDEVGAAAGLGSGIHHCCLLRVPELVVEYRPGPPMPDERIWYAGVFRVLPEQDRIFADAEPPTHDAWSPEDLNDHDRSIVRTTLRKIDGELKRHAAPSATEGAAEGASGGLAGVSRYLGSLLAPAAGQAAGSRNGTRSGTGSPSVIRMLGAPYWESHDSGDVLIQEFEVEAGRAITIDAEVSVRVWGGGGRETEPPLGAAYPALIGWRAPDGTVHGAGRITIASEEHGRWHAIVSTPQDTATRIRVHEARQD
jgi:hypothetical protein